MADTERKTKPFTESGECSDEIIFVFEDEKRLYVSQNFLNYVSPVFKAMFEHNCTEKESRSVTMTGKNYDDVLEFLLCVHPNVQKAVNNDNVLSIAHIAEEYQAELIILKCQHVMLEWLKSELASAQKINQSFCPDYFKAEHARACLNILSKAETLRYQSIVQEACKTIGYFGHAIFTGTIQICEGYGFPPDPDKKCQVNGCKMLFDNLPIELKYSLLLERLRLRDNSDMHVDQPVVKLPTKPQRR